MLEVIVKSLVKNAGILIGANAPTIIKQFTTPNSVYRSRLEVELHKVNPEACNNLIRISNNKRLEEIRDEETKIEPTTGTILRKEGKGLINISKYSGYEFRYGPTIIGAEFLSRAKDNLTKTKTKIAMDASQTVFLDVMRDIYYPEYGKNEYSHIEDREFANAVTNHIDSRLPIPYTDAVVNDLAVYDPTVNPNYNLNEKKHFVIVNELDGLINHIKNNMSWDFEDVVNRKIAIANGNKIESIDAKDTKVLGEVVDSSKEYINPIKIVGKDVLTKPFRFMFGDDYVNDSPVATKKPEKTFEKITNKIDYSNFVIPKDIEVPPNMPSEAIKFTLATFTTLYPDMDFSLVRADNGLSILSVKTDEHKMPNFVYVDDGSVVGGHRICIYGNAVNPMGGIVYAQPIEVVNHPDIAKKILLNTAYIMSDDERRAVITDFCKYQEVYNYVDFYNTKFISDIPAESLDMFYNRIYRIVIEAKCNYSANFPALFGKLGFEEVIDAANFTLSSPGGVSFSCRNDQYINKSSVINQHQQIFNQTMNPNGVYDYNYPMYGEQMPQYYDTGIMRANEQPQIVPPEQAGASSWKGMVDPSTEPTVDNMFNTNNLQEFVTAISNEIAAIIKSTPLSETIIKQMKDKYSKIAADHNFNTLNIDTMVDNCINMLSGAN